MALTSGKIFSVGGGGARDRYFRYSWLINSFKHDCYRKYVSPDFKFGKNNRNIWNLELIVESPRLPCDEDFDNEPVEPDLKRCLIYACVKNYYENRDTIIRIVFSMAGVGIAERSYFESVEDLRDCQEAQKYQVCSLCLNLNTNPYPEDQSDRDQPQLDSRTPHTQVLVLNFTIEVHARMAPDPPKISDDFRKLLKNQNFSDLVIVIGKEVVNVHKAVLAARSPVFLTMLESDMREKMTNRIEIPDINFEVALKLLEYIYTDEIEDIGGCAESLVGAAEKYQLEGLKVKCALKLSEDLTINNVIATLILADLYKISNLQTDALNFISWHKRLLEEMPNLNLLENSYPHLMREIMITLSKH